jgi:hypothetical protein
MHNAADMEVVAQVAANFSLGKKAEHFIFSPIEARSLPCGLLRPLNDGCS